MPNGAVFGLGTDSAHKARSTWTDPWANMTTTQSLVSVAYMSPPAALIFPWTQIPNSGSVVAITCTPDAKLLAAGTDGNLYTRTNIDVGCPWVLVPNSGSMSSVVSLVDGSILGVGTDNTLYRRATLNDAWVKIPNSAGVKSVANLRDGTIVGVGLDNTLRTWTNDAWNAVANSGSVTAIFVQK